MTFSPRELADTLITENDDLVDIADLTGLAITDCQRVDIGYLVLQQCKPFKNSLRDWNALPPANRTYTNFKTHFCDAQIALHKTGEITVKEGINHTEMFNMGTKGVREAFAETTTEQANNINKNEELRNQVDELYTLIEQMNAAQKQSLQCNEMQQQQHYSLQLPSYPSPQNHQPYMMPIAMYNPHGFQFQD